VGPSQQLSFLCILLTSSRSPTSCVLISNPLSSRKKGGTFRPVCCHPMSLCSFFSGKRERDNFGRQLCIYVPMWPPFFLGWFFTLRSGGYDKLSLGSVLINMFVLLPYSSLNTSYSRYYSYSYYYYYY